MTVSLIVAYGGLRPLGPETDHADTLATEHFYCPACEVYGRGTMCWWCGSTHVERTHAPSWRALPTRIHARSMLSAWRMPNDHEHRLSGGNGGNGGAMG